MNETGVMIIIGIFVFGGLILIAIFKKIQDTYGSKKAIRYFLISISSLAFAIFIYVKLFNNNNPCPKCGCDSVDDCLSKNKFVEARKYATSTEVFLSIQRSEFTYWLSAKELDRALLTITEMKKMKTEPYRLTKADLNIAVYESSLDLTRAYCEQGQKEKAEQFIQSLPDKLVIEESRQRISSDNDGSTRNQIELCRKKYYNIKNALKPNQEIEHFKETTDDFYQITTFKYFQKEALKIMEGCKN